MSIKTSKRSGCSILFYNSQQQVLLFLRDDKDSIPCPNMWDILGGHAEKNETPEECIEREMREELDLELLDYSKFAEINFHDRIEHCFFKRLDLDITKLYLREGQKLSWFSLEDVRKTKLAFGFNPLVELFFNQILQKS